jgi:predicted small secreted protein
MKMIIQIQKRLEAVEKVIESNKNLTGAWAEVSKEDMEKFGAYLQGYKSALEQIIEEFK